MWQCLRNANYTIEFQEVRPFVCSYASGEVISHALCDGELIDEKRQAGGISRVWMEKKGNHFLIGQFVQLERQEKIKHVTIHVVTCYITLRPNNLTTFVFCFRLFAASRQVCTSTEWLKARLVEINPDRSERLVRAKTYIRFIGLFVKAERQERRVPTHSIRSYP